MSIPRPSIPLSGHCSTIVDNILYVLSPTGFQSLPLKKKAAWAIEPSGIKVTGPACVTVTPGGDATKAQLWVIGGTSDNANYDGVQVYIFSEKRWENIPTTNPVLQQRTEHSAAWLEDQQAILVYAGSQPDARSYLSSQTFVLSTQAPYGIESFTSNAPPANLPILQPWDSGSVVMVGGSELNKEISIFSPEEGWKQLGTDLVTPLDPEARGTLVEGTDGSKVLEVYDMNVSPNTVTQIILLGAGGATARTGQVLNDTSTTPSSGLRGRDLRIADWPPYHAHLAPTVKRSDYGVVQSGDGIAVISGGNNAEPVALFNQDSNAWLDAGAFFDGPKQQPLKPTTTRKPTPTLPTSSSSSSPSLAAGSAGESTHDKTLRVLGIILGVLFGIAALFVLVLFILRVQKRKKREREGWLEEKAPNSQQANAGDGGAFAKETGGAGKEFGAPTNTPWRQSKNETHNSLGIITGKFAKRLSPKPYAHAHQGSGDSTVQLVKDKQGTAIDPRGPVELADIESRPGLQRRLTARTERSDRPSTAQYGQSLTEQDAYAGMDPSNVRTNRNRSSGWSKYFATSAAAGSNGLAHIPSAYVKPGEEGAAAAAVAAAAPSTGNTSQHSRIASSALVPGSESEPKRMLDGQPVSHVTMRSPAFNDSREDLAKRGSTTTEGQSGLIVDPNQRESQADSISSYNRSATSSARTSEQYSRSSTKPWSPTETTFKVPSTGGTSFKDHLNSRPPSSGEAAAERARAPSRGKDSPFFMGGSGYRNPPKSPKSSAILPPPDAPSWGIPPPPRVVAPEVPLSPRAEAAAAADARDSNATVWPSPVLGHRKGPSADYSKPAEQRAGIATPKNTAQPPMGLGMPMPLLTGAHFDRDAEDRESYVTVVPSAYYAEGRVQRGQQQQQQAHQQQEPAPLRPARPAESDLAWLNLGLGKDSPSRI